MPVDKTIIGTNAPENFLVGLASGRIPGWTQEFIVGITPPNPVNNERSVCDLDISTPRSAIPFAQPIYASSDNASDTNTIVNVTALDSNYDQIVLSATLNGVNQTQLINIEDPLNNDVIWVQNARALSQTPLGDVYIALFDSVTGGVPNTASSHQSRIIQGKNVTRNAWYMVPRGKSAIFTRIGRSTDDTGKPSLILSNVTTLGQPKVVGNEYTIVSTAADINLPMPFGITSVLGQNLAAFDEFTVVDYTSIPSSNNTVTSVSFDLIIVDKNYIGVG